MEGLDALLAALATLITTALVPTAGLYVRAIRNANKERDKRIDALEKSLSNAQQKIIDAENNEQKMQEHYISLQQKYTDLLELNNLLKEKVATIPGLRTQIDMLNDKMTRLQSELQRLANIEHRAEQAEKNAERMQQERDIAITKAETLSAAFDTLRNWRGMIQAQEIQSSEDI